MQQIELTPELKASTDRMLESCDLLERRKLLMDMLEQCNNPKVDKPAFALQYIINAHRDGVLPSANAINLAQSFLLRVQLEIERMKLAELRKDLLNDGDDVRALMGICTAEFERKDS